MKVRKVINTEDKNANLESVISTIDKFKQYESESSKQKI
jgi:hypothetical protein